MQSTDFGPDATLRSGAQAAPGPHAAADYLQDPLLDSGDADTDAVQFGIPGMGLITAPIQDATAGSGVKPVTDSASTNLENKLKNDVNARMAGAQAPGSRAAAEPQS